MREPVKIVFDQNINSTAELFEGYQERLTTEFEIHNWGALEDVLHLMFLEEDISMDLIHLGTLNLGEKETKSYQGIMEGLSEDYGVRMRFRLQSDCG